MKSLQIFISLLISIFTFTSVVKASEVNIHVIKVENISDTAGLKKYNNLSLSKINTNNKFSLNVKKDIHEISVKSYNNFDIKSKKPSYVESVLMRKGNNIQTIPLYRYTLPF